MKTIELLRKNSSAMHINQDHITYIRPGRVEDQSQGIQPTSFIKLLEVGEPIEVEGHFDDILSELDID